MNDGKQRMKRIQYIFILLTIVFNAALGQESLPKLTTSSEVTNLAIYKGDVVLIVPVEEYRETNQKIQSLINIIYSMDEVDSIKDVRINEWRNLDSIRVLQVDSLNFLLAVAAGNIKDLQAEVRKQKKRKRIGWGVATLYLANTARKVYLFVVSL